MMMSLSQPCSSSTFSNSHRVSSTSVELRKTKSHLISHKQPHQVQRRNERERKRVQQVNMGFVKLRDHVPKFGQQNKKLSKVETLREAAKYIRYLQTVLENGDVPSEHFTLSTEEEEHTFSPSPDHHLDHHDHQHPSSSTVNRANLSFSTDYHPIPEMMQNYHPIVYRQSSSYGSALPNYHMTKYPTAQSDKASSSPASSASYASDGSFEDCRYPLSQHVPHRMS